MRSVTGNIEKRRLLKLYPLAGGRGKGKKMDERGKATLKAKDRKGTARRWD